MEIVVHRRNTIAELTATPPEFGVEVDLRPTLDGRIILAHDPFADGEDFEDWLSHYHHGTLILNIKSEGIEWRVRDLVLKRGIENFFFLDSSFPMIYKLISKQEQRIALRFSEFEGFDTIERMQTQVQWVWVDSFQRLALDTPSAGRMREMGYKTCLVSPELQGRPQDIQPMIEYLNRTGIQLDAVCTKLESAAQWLGVG